MTSSTNVETSQPAASDQSDLRLAEQLANVYARMRGRLSKVIIGQDEVLKQVLIALFCQGHCILEGVPGLAKTLMISSIAQLLSLNFRRIQFTPDLMPSDITGTRDLGRRRGRGAASDAVRQGADLREHHPGR